MDKQDELCGQYYCNGVVVGCDHLLLVLSVNSEILHGKNIWFAVCGQFSTRIFSGSSFDCNVKSFAASWSKNHDQTIGTASNAIPRYHYQWRWQHTCTLNCCYLLCVGNGMDIFVDMETVEKVSLQVKCIESLVSMCSRKSMAQHWGAYRYLFANHQCDKCKSCVGKTYLNGRFAWQFCPMRKFDGWHNWHDPSLLWNMCKTGNWMGTHGVVW